MRVAVLVAMALAGQAASAATLDDSVVETLFRTYNAASSGDYTIRSEVEGRVYVGGNLSGGSAQFGFRPLSDSGPVLTVKGDATIDAKIGTTSDNYIAGNLTGNPEIMGGAQASGTTIHVGGSFSGRDNFGLVETGPSASAEIAVSAPDIDFAGLQAYAQFLSTLSGAMLDTSNQNNIALDVLGNAVQSEGTGWNAGDVTVYYVDIADLDSGTLFSDVSADQTIIVNVSGTSGRYGLNPAGNLGNSDGRNIFWNFYEATDLVLGSKLVGSVLAPFASVTGFSGNLEGSIFAAAIDQGQGEIHYQPFAGDLPGATPAVPLPSALSLLAGGLAAVAVLSRRRG